MADSGTCAIQPDGAGDTDRALWATWYDLPGDREAAYLQWLHQSYIPRLIARPSVQWVAHYRSLPQPDDHLMRGVLGRMSMPETDFPELGRGNTFVLLAGGPKVDAFIPSALDPIEGRHGTDAEMLMLRRGRRSYVMVDVLRAPGLAAGEAAGRASPGARIQFGTFRTHPGSDVGLWDFYLANRNPQITQLPGLVSVRQLMGCVGWARLGVLYEFDSVKGHEAFIRGLERKELVRQAGDPHGFQITRTTIHSPGSPTMGERIWPPL